MHQQTPFAKLEDAIKEYDTIFKQKSGNEWADRASFEKKPKKYSLTRINYELVDHKNYLIPFESLPQENIPDSQLNKSVKKFIKVITNCQGYKEALSSYGVNQSIDKKDINEALDVLDKAEYAIEDYGKYVDSK